MESDFSVMGFMSLTTNIVQGSFCVLVFKNYKSYRSYKSYKSYTKFLFVIRVGLRPPCEAHALRGDRFPSPDHKEEFTPTLSLHLKVRERTDARRSRFARKTTFPINGGWKVWR